MANAGANAEDHHNEPFPIMKLPTELRLAVYQCAMGDLVKSITSLRPCPDDIDDNKIYTFFTNPYPENLAIRRNGELYFVIDKLDLNPAPFLGPLALLHTSSVLRAECITPMLLLVDLHYQATKGTVPSLGDQHGNTILAGAAILTGHAIHTGNEAEIDSWRVEANIASNHVWKLKKVRATLEEAARFRRSQGA